MKKSAFTLLELLVVIAIFAILAALIIPVFNKINETQESRVYRVKIYSPSGEVIREFNTSWYSNYRDTITYINEDGQKVDFNGVWEVNCIQ